MTDTRASSQTTDLAGAASILDLEKGIDSETSPLMFDPKFTGWNFGALTPVSEVSLSTTTLVDGKKTMVGNASGTVQLGSSLGVFGGNKEARRALLNALAGNIASCLPSLSGQTKAGAISGHAFKNELQLSYISSSKHALFPCSSPLEEMAFNLRLRDR
jgi:hypothetical protein